MALVRDLCKILVAERSALQRLVQLQAKDSLGVARLFARAQQALTDEVSTSESEKNSCLGPPQLEKGHDEENIHRLLGDFATATTAKDVSIMLTMQRVEYSHQSLRTPFAAGHNARLSGSSAAERMSMNAAWWEHRILGDGMEVLPRWLDLADPVGLSTLDGRAPGQRWVYSLTICDLDPKVSRWHSCACLHAWLESRLMRLVFTGSMVT